MEKISENIDVQNTEKPSPYSTLSMLFGSVAGLATFVSFIVFMIGGFGG